jgi:hypothetical protein
MTEPRSLACCKEWGKRVNFIQDGIPTEPSNIIYPVLAEFRLTIIRGMFVIKGEHFFV